MPSAFDRLFADAAIPALHSVFGIAVTIRRGWTATENVIADWNRAKEDSVTHDELFTQPYERTWYIDHAAYAFDGEEFRPRTGERIDDGEQQWEIVPDGKRAAVRDTGSGQWEIDTKRLEAGYSTPSE